MITTIKSKEVPHTHQQTDRHTDRQTHTHTDTDTDTQAYIQTYELADVHATYIRTDRQMDIQTDGQKLYTL
jgi:hypothetical protein